MGASELALLALLVLAGPAWIVLRAHDARRFAMGVVIAAGLWLLIWYPNLSGLPMPTGLADAAWGRSGDRDLGDAVDVATARRAGATCFATNGTRIQGRSGVEVILLADISV